MFLIIFSLIVFTGMYFSVVRKKAIERIGGQEAYIQSWDISNEAKAIHLKEYRKQTATLFTKEWVLEYWYGKRSFHSAFWISVLFRVLVVIIGIFLYLVTPINFLLFLLGIGSDVLTYVVMWRCSANSRNGYKFTARLFIVLSGLILISNMSGHYMQQMPDYPL